MKEPRLAEAIVGGAVLGLIMALVTVIFVLVAITSIRAEEARREPYSCRLHQDEQKKCAFGSCDARTVERLKRECLRDVGRP